MATGAERAEYGAKRTVIIEPVPLADGSFVGDRARLSQVVDELLSAVWQVGGSIRIVADRVKIGMLPPDPATGRSEPLGETLGAVVEYTTQGPLHASSVTAHLMDQVYEVETQAKSGPSLADAMAAGAGDDDEGEQVDDGKEPALEPGASEQEG